MTSRVSILCLLLSLVAGPHIAVAGQVEKPDPPAAPVEPPFPAEVTVEAPEEEPQGARRPAVQIGSDFTLAEGDTIREAAVIAGNATIAGHVLRDLVVVLGSAEIASTARIDGELVVVGGRVVIQPGATVGRDLVVIGGPLDAPPDFSPGGERVVIGSQVFGGAISVALPWVSRGLLWGRPIVPDLAWVWVVVGFFFLLYLAINVLLEKPVRACAQALAEKPLTTFLIGLLGLLLSGPVVLILFMSVIGIPVVPFAICALLLVGLVGKVGVARWIGMTIVAERSADPDATAPGATLASRSFVIGFALLCVAYMIPVLGAVAWASAGVLALGAGMSAFISSYRRENPAPPRPAVPARGVVVPPTAPVSDPLSSNASQGTYPPPQDAFAPPPLASAPPAGVDLTAFPYASFRDRFAAFVLDLILVVITSFILDLGRDGERKLLFLLLAYHIAFWAWKGTTVGGIICQLRVVRTTGQPLSFADALVRGLSSIFSLAVLGIGALWILKDADRQSWHDKIAGTYVVKVPRNYPI